MKKNLRTIPKEIYSKLQTIKSQEIVVGCAIKFKKEMLESGRLKHLGITLSPEGLQVPEKVVAPANQGRYSAQNIEGNEIVRKDLPKETHYNTIESPNWGGLVLWNTYG
jgi:hypothetical protein